MIKIIFVIISQIIWEPEKPITYFQDGTVYHPRICAFGDSLHVVFYRWYRDTDSVIKEDVYYLRSIDAGSTWSEPKNLTVDNSLDDIFPSICSYQNKVHVVYTREISPGEDTIKYKRSLDGGLTWENARGILLGNGGRISNKGDTLFVIGGSPFTQEFYFIKSLNGGNTWSSVEIIDTGTGGSQIKVMQNFLHIAGLFSNEVEIAYFRSPDLGNTWEGPFLISPQDDYPSQMPAMAVSDTNVYIIWSESIGCSFGENYNINLRKSHDNGNVFYPREVISDLCRTDMGDVYAKDSIVIVVYVDDRDAPGQYNDLYYRISYDYGNTWTAEEKLVDRDYALWPALSGSGDEIYIVWRDRDYENTGRLQIFFKKGKISTKINERDVKIRNINIFSKGVLILPSKMGIYVSKGKKYFLNLYDKNGRKIKILKEGTGKGKEEIFLKDINPGEYFIVLEVDNKKVKKKITILKGGDEP